MEASVGQSNTVGLLNPLNSSGSKIPHTALEPTHTPSPPSLDSIVVYEPPVAGDLIQRTWGSASNWMLELRDGRRLSIPLFLICTMPTHIGEACRGKLEFGPIELEPLDSSSDGNSSRHWLATLSEEEDDDADVSVVWEDPIPSDGGRDVVCWGDEEEPLEVTPLAMVAPCDVGSKSEGVLTLGDADKASKSPTLVLEHLKKFGISMGVSFEGFEEDILNLLKSIEERRLSQEGQGGTKKKVPKLGGKGSRELKNLISTINYDVGASSSRGNSRDKGLLVSP